VLPAFLSGIRWVREVVSWASSIGDVEE